MNKTRYTPTGLTKAEDFSVEGLYETYTGELAGKPIAIFYIGRQSNPVWYNRFQTATDMGSKINASIKSVLSRQEMKEQRKAARKVGHTLKVGDILYSSWGYDQTNVNFYQVIKVVGKNTVQIREISSKVVRDEGPTTYVTAYKDMFLVPRGEYDTRGKVMTKRVSASNGVNVSSAQYATLWDGQPKYETGMGYGH